MDGRRRRPRAPGLIYAALSMAVLSVVSVVALTASQPPPPTIAEFAPQAQEQIEEAPDEQSSDFGSGDGECPPGVPNCEDDGLGDEPTPTPVLEPTPEPVDVPRVRQCVGDPPRQIEDPQSPPCVPHWEGDNGGATYQGVTENEIRVAMPDFAEDRDRALEAFFNSRFEFYGRQLRLIECCREGGAPEDQQASAVQADEEEAVFASADYPDRSEGYYRELARRGIVGISNQPNYTTGTLAAHHPYIWQYPLAVDRMFANLGEWGCERLAGRNAEFAGRSDIQDLSEQERRFGIILWTYSADAELSSAPLERELERCGVAIEAKRHMSFDEDGVFNQDQATNAVLEMKSAGVTTILCLCHGIPLGAHQRGASAQAYEPEWVVLTYLLQDYNFMVHSFTDQPTQRERMFGLSFIPKQVPLSENPAWWALKEGDPGADGRGNETSAGVTPLNINYRALLLLASGIQTAGPNLTPKSFAEGLQGTVFPNSDHPIMAGDVGFVGGGPHSMTTDAAEIWWSDDHQGPYQGERGTYCYVDGGARHRKGAWPSGGGGLFNGDCRF